jgi:peptidoglycan-N-acetylmuramic acid deacetylase
MTVEPTLAPSAAPTKKPEDLYPGLNYSVINSKSREGFAYGVDTSVVPARIWNTEASRIEKWGGIVEGDTTRKVIYLTFNLGTEKGHTERTVDILNKHGAKATFFCLGEYVGFNPDIVKKIHESGHLIANHGDKHILTADYRTEFAVANIADFHKTLKEKTGIVVKKKFFRPPSGYYCERDMEIAAQLGETTVLWGYAYNDYGATQALPDNEILANLTGNITNGRIFQLHTVNEGNSDALEAFILKAYELGYELETLAEID